MKIRFVFLAIGLALGLLMASCSASSKTCPAYSSAETEVSDTGDA